MYSRFSLNSRVLRVAQAACTREEGFGCAEVEVHVEAHGDMVLVVGDVEGDEIGRASCRERV